MIYKVISLLLMVSLASCAVEIDNTGTSGIAPAGIYTGTITADGFDPEAAITIITSTNQVAVINEVTKESFVGTRVDNALTGTLYASGPVPTTAEVTSVSAGDISGTYTNELGDGTIELSTTGLYERPSDLMKLEGAWVDVVYTNALDLGASRWDIYSSGGFIVWTESSACNGYGQFTVFNPSNNEYAMTMTIESCGDFDGVYDGFAFLSDTDSNSTTDSTLTLIFSNGEFGGVSQPIK